MSGGKAIDVDAALKADFEKAKQKKSGSDSAILHAFDLSRQLVGAREEHWHVNTMPLCRALLQLCMTGEGLRPSFQYKGVNYNDFKSRYDTKPHQALLSAWEGACANLQDAKDDVFQGLHTDFFDRSQITVSALAMADMHNVKNDAQFKEKAAELDAFGAHLIQNAESKDQQHLKDQIEEIKKLLPNPFAA